MDDYVKNELKPYVELLIELGIEPHLAELFEVRPLFQHPDSYDHLIRGSLKLLRNFDLSDEARWVICGLLQYFMKGLDRDLQAELRKVLRTYWLEIVEVYRQTPNFESRRNDDAEQSYSRTQGLLAQSIEKEFTQKHRETLLDLIRDERNGDSRSILLFPLRRAKRSKWVQDFLSEMKDDPDIGNEVKELML